MAMKRFRPFLLSLIFPLAACQGNTPTHSPPATIAPSLLPSAAPLASPTPLVKPSESPSSSPDASSSASASPGSSSNPSSNPSAEPSPTVSASAAPLEEKLTIKKYPQNNSNSPWTEVINGKGEYFMFWAAINESNTLAVNHARFTDKDRNYWMVFYNDDGAIERIQNEKTGEFVIVEPKEDSFTIKAFEATGKFDSGYKVTQNNGKYYASPVLGRPYFSGQLTLDLRGATKTISAVLLPEDENASGTALELPANLQNYLNRSDVLPNASQFTILAASSLSSGLAKTTQASKLALAGLLAQRSMSGLLTASGAKLAGPLLDIGLIAASNWQLSNGAPTSTGNMVSDIGARFEHNLSVEDIAKEHAAIAGSNGTLTTPKSVSAAQQGKLEGIYPKTDDRFLRVPGTLPLASVRVSGFSVDNDGATVNLTGNVTSAGLLTASGNSTAGSLSIASSTNNKLANGTYTSYLGSGVYVGRAEALGTCASQQKSGGQGTYVRAHYMNNGTDKNAVGSGTTVFSYEAYSIPDQFTVFTLDGKKFGTPGLVTGSGTANIPVPKNWIVIVSVNAPEDQTAWAYDLTCPLGGSGTTATPLTQTTLATDHVVAADLTTALTESISVLYSDNSTEASLDLAATPTANTPAALQTALNSLLSTGSFTVTELQAGGTAGNGTLEAGDRLHITLSTGATRANKKIAGVTLNGGIFAATALNMPAYKIAGS